MPLPRLQELIKEANELLAIFAASKRTPEIPGTNSANDSMTQ
jgi:hypothetical protein